MSVPPMRGIAIAAAATLCGCQLVAGIENLSLTNSTDAGPVSSSEEFEASTGLGNTSASTNGEIDGTIADVSTGTYDASVQESSSPDASDNDSANADAGTSADAGPIDGFPADVQGEAIADGGDASLTLTLIDDQNGTGVPVGWLDGVIPGNPVAGTWFVFDDGSDGGVLAPAAGSPASEIIVEIPDGGPGSSTHAAQVMGNADFVSYGAGIGFNLNATLQPAPYNASAYQGFVFWARALGDAGTTLVRFEVLDKNTAPPSSGGVCDGGACNGYYGVNLNVAPDWQEFTVFFDQLTRPVYAVPDGLPFDPTNLIGCQFQVNQGVAFDLWITDVYFIDN